MKPTIRHFESMNVVGVGGRFISAMSPDANNLKVIPGLWQEYLPRSRSIPGRLGDADMGVVARLSRDDKPSHPHEMLYVACTPVAGEHPVPDGMMRLAIPAGSYAVVTHVGPVEQIGQTMKWIYATWLPQSGMKLRNAPDLEIYDHRFEPGSATSEFDVCIPVE